MEHKSPWPLALKYGLVIAFASIAVNLVFYLINPNAASSANNSLKYVEFLLNAMVCIYLFIVATKTRRDVDLDGYISYGASLSFMLRVALPAAVIISIYSYIFLTYINPESLKMALDMQADQMAKQGKSDEEIEAAMRMAQKFTTPMWMTIIGTLGTMVQFVIFALLGSIFTQKKPTNSFE